MSMSVRMEKNIFPALAGDMERRKNVIVEETRQDIVATARMLVPVDTGALMRSIVATSIGVAVNSIYAAIIEYGAPPLRKAQPYFTPAIELHRPRMIERLRTELFTERRLSARSNEQESP